MGYPMASNIRRKMSPNATLYVNDVYRPACARFMSEFRNYGPVEITESAKEAAENASVVVSIVPAAEDVRQVYLDKLTGVIAATRNPTRLILECSTIDTKSAIAVGEELRSAGAGIYVDTPVSVGLHPTSFPFPTMKLSGADPKLLLREVFRVQKQGRYHF